MLTGPDLFRVIADLIEEDPEKYNQEIWGMTEEDEDAPFATAAEHMAINTCGTEGCIAGWAVALNFPFVKDELQGLGNHAADVSGIATRLLEINNRTASTLFDQNWKPAEGMTVPEALRQLADGVGIYEVTGDNDD